MKNPIPVLASGALLLATGCAQFSNRGTVENPYIESATTGALSFDKIELTDSSTVLHGVVHFRPGYWIRISSGSAIVADGDTLVLQSAEGIVPDKELWMPDSGVAHFSLTFPPVQAGVKSIDFTECAPDGWSIWGIDLTGEPSKPSGFDRIPSRLLGDAADAEWPEIKLATDSVTVNVHLLGYRRAMGAKLSYFMNTLVGQNSDLKPLPIDADGNATYKGVISGPSVIYFYGVGETDCRGEAILSPGETVDLYVDMSVSGQHNMAMRGDKRPNIPMAYGTGVYGPLMQAVRNCDAPTYVLEIFSENFGDYHMNADEYTDYILKEYDAKKDSIDALGCNPLVKRMRKAELDASLIVAAAQPREWLRGSYYKANGFTRQVPADSIRVEMTPAHLRRVAERVNLNNPDFLLLRNYIQPDMVAEDAPLWSEAGIDASLLSELRTYIYAYNKVDEGNFTDADLDELRKLSKPFYAEAVEAHRKALAEFMKTAALDRVSPTPDVAPGKLFDAIVAPYKGKVVMVDLWNTWCAPCRASIKANEPLKDGELPSDDIVWIYIADESSPISTYLDKIAEIRGVHYRVTDEQISTIRSRFGVDGIPYYILVGRDGKAVGRPDLRDHDKYKKAILDAVAQK